MKETLKKVYGWSVLTAQTIVSVLSVLIFSSFKCNKVMKKISKGKRNNNAVVLGNGPSLKECLDEHIDVLEGKDLMCVNNFCLSPFFEKLKPEFYILTDPRFFDEKYDKDAKQQQIDFLNAMSRVSWHFYLFVPFINHKSNVVKSLNKNEYIDVVYYNYTPVVGYKCFEHFIFKNNLGMPEPQNVTNAAAFVMTGLGYSTIFMLGIEHSWLKNFYVSDKNQIVLVDNHFYDTNEYVQEFPMYDWLRQIGTAFKSHMRINEYAQSLGVKIFNSTHGSFVDAYERNFLY